MTSELKSMFGENCPEQTSQPQQNSQKELERKKKRLFKETNWIKERINKINRWSPFNSRKDWK